MSNQLHKVGRRSHKKLKVFLLTLLLVGFAGYGLHNVGNLKQDLHSQQVQTRQTETKLELKNDQLEKVKQEKVEIDTTKQQQIEKLEQEKKDLEAQLQAKLEAKNKLAKAADDALRVITATPKASAAALPAEESVQTYSAPAPVARATGSGCDYVQSLLANAGVSAADMPAAMYIANHESTCNPGAQNPNMGACNIFQELPCGKWGGLGNTDAHIQGAIAYANARYGGWWGAYNFWTANQWW